MQSLTGIPYFTTLVDVARNRRGHIVVMKARIISLSKGLVQIGSTIFQPFTGKKFFVTEFEVSDDSMDEAKRVLVEYLKTSCTNKPEPGI